MGFECNGGLRVSAVNKKNRVVERTDPRGIPAEPYLVLRGVNVCRLAISA